MSHTGLHATASRRQLILVLGFTILFVIAAAILSVARGNSEFVFYIAVMAVIVIGLIAVHRRVGLSAGLLWCLSAWGLLHMAGGLAPIPADWHSADVSGVLYNLRILGEYLKYDQVVHAYGFGITTWLCWQALSARVLNEEGGPLRPTPGLLVLCAAGGIGFGALNEVIEFFATLTLPETNVGGYVNTGWDLVANLAGATVTAVILYAFYRQPPDTRAD